jgi:predicted TIM-barrel fold metal-dependent hydrolase
MIIDIHVHCHKKRLPGICRANGSQYPALEQLIAAMDTDGIDMAVLMCCVSPECRNTLVAPEEVLEICAEYPDRFIPFCDFDPRNRRNDESSDFRPLLRAYIEAGCRGVGEYFPSLPLDDPLNMNFFGQVEECGVPLLFHLAHNPRGTYGCLDEPGLPRLEKVLKTFPDLVLLGHSPVFWNEINNKVENPEPGRLIELMRKYPNLCGDLSAGSGYNAISRDPELGCRFMEEFQDRLYFGTDIASVNQNNPIVEYFRKIKQEHLIATAAYEKITWRNAAKLLKLQIV